MSSLHPTRWERAGETSLLIKQREPDCYWQLWFFHFDNEDVGPGMHLPSQPLPSKPVRPRRVDTVIRIPDRRASCSGLTIGEGRVKAQGPIVNPPGEPRPRSRDSPHSGKSVIRIRDLFAIPAIASRDITALTYAPDPQSIRRSHQRRGRNTSLRSRLCNSRRRARGAVRYNSTLRRMKEGWS